MWWFRRRTQRLDPATCQCAGAVQHFDASRVTRFEIGETTPVMNNAIRALETLPVTVTPVR